MSGGHLCEAKAPTEAAAETEPLRTRRETQEGEHKTVQWTVFAWGNRTKGSPEKLATTKAPTEAAAETGTPADATRNEWNRLFP